MKFTKASLVRAQTMRDFTPQIVPECPRCQAKGNDPCVTRTGLPASRAHKARPARVPGLVPKRQADTAA